MKKTGAAKKKNSRRGRAKKVGPYNPDEWIAEQKERTHNGTILEQKVDVATEVLNGNNTVSIREDILVTPDHFLWEPGDMICVG